jgi:hypothetical protein
MKAIPTITGAALLLAATLVPLPGAAVDGVIEINQSRALAGGVTPGDAPGFPVTISARGSYRLTGNLDLTAPGAANDPVNTHAHSPYKLE